MAVLVAEFELKIPKADLVVAEVLGRETSFHSVLSAATILVSALILSNDNPACATLRRRKVC